MKLKKSHIEALVFGMIFILMITNHTNDNNIWGIYIENGHLLIGDFWASILTLTSGYNFLITVYGILNE